MPVFPPSPTDTIDWSNVGFQVREVNGHVQTTYSKSTGKWSPLRFVRDPFLKIHGMAPGLNYGQQAYEGLKAFRAPGDQKIQIFRPAKNAVRMQHSASVVSMPAVPETLFIDAVKAAVAHNAAFVPPHETGAAMYIRPLLFGSSAQLGLSPPEEYTFCVFVIPTGVYHGTAPVKALILDEFDRAAPNGTGHAKVGGNYAPVLPWSSAAYADGFGITLHLDSRRHHEVDEFSTSGFLGVKKSVVDGAESVTVVVPDSQNVIDSVTSASVQELATSFGWTVEKRPIPYTELPEFNEILAAGTAAALVPIRSITRRIARDAAGSLAQAGDSLSPAVTDRVTFADSGNEETIRILDDAQTEAGEACARFLTTLKGIQQGKLDDPYGWVTPVQAEDLQKATE